jgi:menaquinone-9 beta-reductase
VRTATINATITLSEASARQWDAVVVGAGPAGATAARQLARVGRAVLLADRASFPRSKVCGCCLNSAALDSLDSIGLGGLPRRLGARPLSGVRVAFERAQTRIRLPGGAAVSRDAFDAALVEEAIRAGAAFLPRSSASVPQAGLHPPRVTLRTPDGQAQVATRAIVAADGLAGRVLGDAHGLPTRVAPRSRLGCGAVVCAAPGAYDAGVIHMACARGGYVGLVRLEDDRLDVAAAFDVGFVRTYGSPGAAAAAVLESCRLPPVRGLSEAPWRGTPALTRRRPRLQRGPLFAVGDSAAYVEPFTGEGIAWALASGIAAAPFVEDAVSHGPLDEEYDAWTAAHRRLFARRHSACRAITLALRHPRVGCLAVRMLAMAPALATPFIRAMNGTRCRAGAAPRARPA